MGGGFFWCTGENQRGNLSLWKMLLYRGMDGVIIRDLYRGFFSGCVRRGWEGALVDYKAG